MISLIGQMFRASLVLAWVLSGTIAYAAPAADVAAKPQLAQPVLALLKLCSCKGGIESDAAVRALAELHVHINTSGAPTPEERAVLNFLGGPRREGALEAVRGIIPENFFSTSHYGLEHVVRNVTILTTGGSVVVNGLQEDKIDRWMLGTAKALGGSDVPLVPPVDNGGPSSKRIRSHLLVLQTQTITPDVFAALRKTLLGDAIEPALKINQADQTILQAIAHPTDQNTQAAQALLPSGFNFALIRNKIRMACSAASGQIQRAYQAMFAGLPMQEILYGRIDAAAQATSDDVPSPEILKYLGYLADPRFDIPDVLLALKRHILRVEGIRESDRLILRAIYQSTHEQMAAAQAVLPAAYNLVQIIQRIDQSPHGRATVQGAFFGPRIAKRLALHMTSPDQAANPANKRSRSRGAPPSVKVVADQAQLQVSPAVLGILRLVSHRDGPSDVAALEPLKQYLELTDSPPPGDIVIFRFLRHYNSKDAQAAVRGLIPEDCNLANVAVNLGAGTLPSILLRETLRGDKMSGWLGEPADVPAEPRRAPETKKEPPIEKSPLPVTFAQALMPFSHGRDQRAQENAVVPLMRAISGRLLNPADRDVRNYLFNPNDLNFQRAAELAVGDGLFHFLQHAATQLDKFPQWRDLGKSRSPQPIAPSAPDAAKPVPPMPAVSVASPKPAPPLITTPAMIADIEKRLAAMASTPFETNRLSLDREDGQWILTCEFEDGARALVQYTDDSPDIRATLVIQDRRVTHEHFMTANELTALWAIIKYHITYNELREIYRRPLRTLQAKIRAIEAVAPVQSTELDRHDESFRLVEGAGLRIAPSSLAIWATIPALPPYKEVRIRYNNNFGSLTQGLFYVTAYPEEEGAKRPVERLMTSAELGAVAGALNENKRVDGAKDLSGKVAVAVEAQQAPPRLQVDQAADKITATIGAPPNRVATIHYDAGQQQFVVGVHLGGKGQPLPERPMTIYELQELAHGIGQRVSADPSLKAFLAAIKQAIEVLEAAAGTNKPKQVKEVEPQTGGEFLQQKLAKLRR